MLFHRSILVPCLPAPEINTGNFAPAETTSEANNGCEEQLSHSNSVKRQLNVKIENSVFF